MQKRKKLTEKELEEYLKRLAETVDVELPPFEEVWEKIKDRVASEEKDD